ncbi:MAG: hypothetical protein H7210_00055 [Pyrinomonadaceae bacterium]|nr:hypothetical protein [Phycisphaerales bacterium]
MADHTDHTDQTELSREDFVAVTVAAKARAEAVLKELLAASAECESQLQKQSRTDPIRLVTGRSSLDAAITSTRRMIETIDRTIQDAKRAAENTGKAGHAKGAATGATSNGKTDSAVWIAPARARVGLA